MNTLTPKELLLQAKANILAKPQLYSQGSLCALDEKCGTPACIAGHISAILGDAEIDFQALSDLLDPQEKFRDEEGDWIWLFHYGWEGNGERERLWRRFLRVRTDKGAAKIAAEAIDLFIQEAGL